VKVSLQGQAPSLPSMGVIDSVSAQASKALTGIAIKYLDGQEATSGHIAIVNARPRLMVDVEPLIAGTEQYEVEIIDSAMSGHGNTDTRLQADGSWDDGVGKGIMRIYAEEDGAIRGYSWSTYPNSEYHPQQIKALLIGRWNPDSRK